MSQNASLILTLQPNNPCNTTITDQEDGGKTVYEVYTRYEPSTTTFVENAAGDVIASWKWREIRSDIITLGGASPTPVSSWLKKSIVPLKDTVTFEAHTGYKYKWKGNGPGLSFELYREDDKIHPIARFQKPSRNAKSTQTPARLIFDERGEEIRDLVVISFLVLERSRRETENSTAFIVQSMQNPL
ncbi:uncharacterized protein EV420DRAFT_68894 [Desarmillaria tabescens]|uniref:DUF6593 domain-containing protein n=1 Tax=Armillaria tabescens TaxID=1929756 RepID=A0AA39NQH4_ARMTA|nr:uncharacterized protein EV420DRAFT_68894 [Desarmillaria tabescens]KAK0469820.1 hypothetical protein EV420DRAFT_68894 [Desarmillaria tabescens]